MLVESRISWSAADERLAHRGEDALGHRDGLGAAAHVLAAHDELVAAEPGDGVRRPHAGPQPRRGLDEDRVAGWRARASRSRA